MKTINRAIAGVCVLCFSVLLVFLSYCFVRDVVFVYTNESTVGYFEKVDRKYKTIYLHYYNAFEYKEVKAATHVRRGLLEDLGDAMSETVYYQRWFDVVYLEGDAAKPTTMKLVLDFIGLIMLVFPVYTSGKLLIKGGKVFSRERNKSKGRSRKQLGKSGRMYKHS